MNVVQIIKNLKKYSCEFDEKKKRNLIGINKYIKDEYSYGFVINKINDKYETYMFVLSNTEDIIASNLLSKEFKLLDNAKEYFNLLVTENKDLTLDELYKKF